MSMQSLIVGAVGLLTSASVAGQQVQSTTPSPSSLLAVTDCRAGCQGGEGNCQQSEQAAVFVASEGYHLILGSQTLTRHWNASDSPGLRSVPRWITESFPPNSDTPLRITIRPDISTCVGVSPDTQGVTFYEFQVLQQR